jgi:hypothetical protein
MHMERFNAWHNRRIIITAILACATAITGALLHYSPVYAPSAPASHEPPREFYGYLRDMREGEGTIMILVNEIEFLSGEEAITKAMGDTGCPRERISDCVPSLNNDYYLRAKDPNTYSYRIAPDAAIAALKNGTSPEEVPMSSEQFAAHYKSFQTILRSMPFAFTAQDSTITKIEQKYIP